MKVVKLKRVSKIDHQSDRYDIQVANTSNFFADGILVHNSFVGIGLLPPRDRGPQHIENRFVVFSKGLGKQGLCFKDNDANANNLYLRTLKQLGVFDKLESLYNDHTLMMPLDAPVFLLGEIFGVGVQDLSYGCTKPTFRAFKVFQGYRDNMTMMSYDQFVSFTDYAGIERVPILYRGPFNKQVLQQYTTGTDTISGSHVREGLVIEPVNPVRDPRFGHVILKSVSDDYLFRGGKPTEYQ